MERFYGVYQWSQHATHKFLEYFIAYIEYEPLKTQSTLAIDFLGMRGFSAHSEGRYIFTICWAPTAASSSAQTPSTQS